MCAAHQSEEVLSSCTPHPPCRPANTTVNQGSKSEFQNCTATASEDGWMAVCYTAGCRNTPSWNGMPSTCYCPIYRFK